MTTQVETLTYPEVQPEGTGKWSKWEDALGRPAGTVRGIAYASRAPNTHDLLLLIDRALYHSDFPTKPAWAKVTELRGNPFLHGLSAVVVDGRLRVYAISDDMLLRATRAENGTWDLREEMRPPFGNVAQFFAVQDDKVTDLYAVSTDGDIYTLRPETGSNWTKALEVGRGPSSMVGAASSAPGRREIAVGAAGQVRLFISVGDGPFIEKEPLSLDLTPQHVLLAAPRSKGALYAVGIAGDARVASSRFYHEAGDNGDWSHVATGGAGTPLLGQSTAAAISMCVECINLMVTEKNGLVSPRQYR